MNLIHPTHNLHIHMYFPLKADKHILNTFKSLFYLVMQSELFLTIHTTYTLMCVYMNTFLSLTETLQQRLWILWHVKNVQLPQVQVSAGEGLAWKRGRSQTSTGPVTPLVSHFVARRPHSQRQTHPHCHPQRRVCYIFSHVPSKLQVG